jgi:hypothetical protein
MSVMIRSAIIFLFTILSLTATAKAMAPLVPADSGIAVRVGDTVAGHIDFGPPCVIRTDFGKYGIDVLTITSKNDSNFHYWCEMGQMFHATFTPTQVGVYRDTVRFRVHFGFVDYDGKRICPDWDSGPVPLVYHATSDSGVNILPTSLPTFQMRYDFKERRYVSLQRCGLRFQNNTPDTSQFIGQVALDTKVFSKHISFLIDSSHDSSKTLGPHVGQFIALSTYISDTMPPLTYDTTVSFQMNCLVKNSSTDSIFQLKGGLFQFYRVDSGKAVMLGDSMLADAFVYPPCEHGSYQLQYKDSTNFYSFVNADNWSVATLFTPHQVGLYTDTLTIIQNNDCGTWVSPPIPLTYHAIPNTKKLSVKPSPLPVFHMYYDEGTSRYFSANKCGLRLTNNSADIAEFTSSIFIYPYLFSKHILIIIDSIEDSVVSLPKNFGQYIALSSFITEPMLPLLRDTLINFTLVCAAKQPTFDTTFLLTGKFQFHFLDSGKAILVGDKKKVNDTILLPTLVNQEYPYTLTYHDSSNFEFDVDPGTSKIVADYKPKQVGLYHDTLYVDYADPGFNERHSGPIPIVYHAIMKQSVEKSYNIVKDLNIITKKDKLVINFESNNPSPISLSISDITGRTIDHICTNKFYQPGSYSMDYIPHMPSGQYFLSFSTKDGTKVVPFSYVR